MVHLPDELVVFILSYLSHHNGSEEEAEASQTDINHFCLVSRQWYDVGIAQLYEAPYLAGFRYELFVRTICPSVLAHIRKSQLAPLVKKLDLSRIVHQGSKSVTARLLSRTKNNLKFLVAPRASFAINCWAALSKCKELEYLDLSLVSQAIEYQSLTQTLRNLTKLTHLFLPRCSSHEFTRITGLSIIWPPALQHLTLSGSIEPKFFRDLYMQVGSFPHSLTSLAITHCRNLDYVSIQTLLMSLSAEHTLRTLKLHDLTEVPSGEFDGVLQLAPQLKDLTIEIDYISNEFARCWELEDALPDDEIYFHPSPYPLERLTLVNSDRNYDSLAPDAFQVMDLIELIGINYLTRLRYVTVAASTQWHPDDIHDLWRGVRHNDKKNWRAGRWHYEGLVCDPAMKYEEWVKTEQGEQMRPRVRQIDM